MKTYVCDCCNTVITDPYEARMKEFYYGVGYDFGVLFPVKTKNRCKLHLCGKCFENLKHIAERKEGAE